jgi:hypothetical protein
MMRLREATLQIMQLHLRCIVAVLEGGRVIAFACIPLTE